MSKQKKKSPVPYASEDIILIDMALQPSVWAQARHGDEVVFGYYYLGYDYANHIVDLGLMPARMPAAFTFLLNLRSWYMIYREEVSDLDDEEASNGFNEWLEKRFFSPIEDAVDQTMAQVLYHDLSGLAEQHIRALRLISKGTKI